MKKILILGGNGFIGHHLIKNLLEKKIFKIYCIDISQNRLREFNNKKNFFFFKGDVLVNNKWIDSHIKKCDVILPLVAIATPLLYVKKPLDVFKISFEANLPIIKKCLKYKKKLIFPSTSEVYGKSNDKEFNPYTSDLVLGPISKQRWIYSCIKQMLDRFIYACGEMENLNYTIFRPFNWYGPGLDDIDTPKEGGSRVITQFLGNIKRREDLILVDGGKQRRCFTHIYDGIDALSKIIEDENKLCNKKIYNIGNPYNDFSIKELAQKLLKIAIKNNLLKKNEIKIKIASSEQFYKSKSYQDVQNRVPYINNTIKELNWRPKINLEEGLESLIKNYL